MFEKMRFCQSLKPRSAPRSQRWAGLCLALAAAFSPLASQAQVIVSTLGGGPTSLNPNQAGYADGNTFEDSQFNFPQGLALDSNGSIFLADRVNGMIRKVTSPGSEAASLTSTFIRNLSQPVGVAIDATNNVYVLTYGDGMLREYDQFGNLFATNAAGLSHPSALAIDPQGRLFFTEETAGDVKELLPDGQIIMLAAGFSSPEGVAVMPSGLVAVSDTGNNAIRLVNPSAPGQPALTLTGGLGAGFADGGTNVAQFNRPFGLAVSPNGALVVADRFNHRVRMVDKNGITTTLYGVDQGSWTNTYPGWLDGTVGVDNVAAREPVAAAVAQNGTVYVTEDYWQILREAAGAPLGNPVVTTNGTTNFVTIVQPPIFGPAYGYFPSGTSITVTSLYSTVYYTLDGSAPTTNSPQLTIIGGVGTLQWINSSNDLAFLRIVAFNGTNSSVIVSGEPPPQDEIGLARDVAAGPGAGVFLPISVNLRPGDKIQSFAYRIEFVPLGGAPPLSNIQSVNITTNDFVPLPSVSTSGTSATYSFQPYQAGATNGVVVSAVGKTANFNVQNSAVLNVIKIEIPGDALPGQSYSVTMATNSATSDGAQTLLPVANMPVRHINIASIGYLVGDTSPGTWYNAGDFSDGRLDISDVDNAFYASLGLALPYSGSDVFDAMDSFPLDQPGHPGGDGEIRFLDWQVTLARSLGFETYWKRAWINPGIRTNWMVSPDGAPLSVSEHSGGSGPVALDLARASSAVVSAPGNVWFRQAVIGSTPPAAVQPGAICVVPVYVKILSGYSLGGLQFRATVAGGNGAPTPGPVTFTNAPAWPQPLQAASPSLGANEAAVAWSLGAFNPPLTGSNLLGSLVFALPTSAAVGQTYSIHFSSEDGAPNLQTQYDLEALAGVTGVGIPSAVPASITSDEWKLHFFGSPTNTGAADGADPDGDGVPNWMEYVAGTDPTDPNSRLLLGISGAAAAPAAGVLSWLSAPGKNYVIETASSLQFPQWNLISTNFAGDGNWKTSLLPSAAGGSSKFYRLRLQP
jgi:sugar lactone lactonase YvrE